MKNRIYLPTKAEQPRRECQHWLMKNRIYILPEPEQPRRERQCSVANEKSNLSTFLGRTTTARMSVFSG